MYIISEKLFIMDSFRKVEKMDMEHKLIFNNKIISLFGEGRSAMERKLDFFKLVLPNYNIMVH